MAVDRRDRRQYTTLARSIRSARAASSLVYAHVRTHVTRTRTRLVFGVYIYIYIYSTRHVRHRTPRPPTGGSSTSVVVNAPPPQHDIRRVKTTGRQSPLVVDIAAAQCQSRQCAIVRLCRRYSTVVGV